MYTVLSLKQMPLFEEYHRTESEFTLEDNMENILDSLTGLVSRKYMIGYAKFLIANKKPFRLCILDLDNFKQINDNYGHINGDLVLQKTSHDLMDYVGPSGLCGRFGGDEYLIILYGEYNYDDIYSFLRNMFHDAKSTCKNVFRKTLKFDDFCPFITATLGCASYPEDASNYEDLFLNADKALYRGKTKGRNCFIIYLEEKHKDIDISKMRKKSIFDSITRMYHLIDLNITPNKKIKRVFDVVKDYISSVDVAYIDDNGLCEDLGAQFDVSSIDSMLDFNGQYFVSERHTIKSKKLYNKLKEIDISSIIVQKCIFNKNCYGYVMIFDKNIQHIWQEEDCLVAVICANVIAQIKFILDKN